MKKNIAFAIFLVGLISVVTGLYSILRHEPSQEVYQPTPKPTVNPAVFKITPTPEPTPAPTPSVSSSKTYGVYLHRNEWLRSNLRFATNDSIKVEGPDAKDVWIWYDRWSNPPEHYRYADRIANGAKENTFFEENGFSEQFSIRGALMIYSGPKPEVEVTVRVSYYKDRCLKPDNNSHRYWHTRLRKRY